LFIGEVIKMKLCKRIFVKLPVFFVLTFFLTTSISVNVFASGEEILIRGGLGVLEWLMFKPNSKKSDKESDEKKETMAQLIEREYKTYNEIDLKIGAQREKVDFVNNKTVVINDALVNNFKGAIFVAIDESTNSYIRSIYYNTGEDMEDFAQLMKKDELGKKQHVRKIFLKYTRIDLGPIESETIAQLAYVPQKGDPIGKVVVSIGRAPDQRFEIQLNGKKLEGAEMLAYYLTDGSVLVIGLFNGRVVNWNKYADKAAYQKYYEKNVHIASTTQ